MSFNFGRRTADVRTVGYVECFVLSKEDVLSAIRDYPEAQVRLNGRENFSLKKNSMPGVSCVLPRLVLSNHLELVDKFLK